MLVKYVSCDTLGSLCNTKKKKKSLCCKQIIAVMLFMEKLAWS